MVRACLQRNEGECGGGSEAKRTLRQEPPSFLQEEQGGRGRDLGRAQTFPVNRLCVNNSRGARKEASGASG